MPSNDIRLELRYSSTRITPEFLLQPARKFMPQWYTQMPRKGPVFIDSGSGQAREVITARSCPGIVHVMSRGFIAPMPFDMVIKITRDGYDVKVPSDYEQLVEVHHPAQLNYAGAGKTLVVKIGLAYSLRSNKSADFVYFNPVMHNIESLNGLHVPTGIINFRDQYSLNAFVLIPIDAGEKEYPIKMGTPLLQIVPATERRVHLDCVETESWMMPPANTFFTSFIEKAKYMRRIRGD